MNQSASLELKHTAEFYEVGGKNRDMKSVLRVILANN